MGSHSLRMLESAARRRNEVAALYREGAGALPGIAFQQCAEGNRNSYKDFSITVDPDVFGLGRDELAVALAAENVDTRKYYDPPVHRQTAYNQFATDEEMLDNTELLASRSLSLPIWSHMDDEVVLDICRAMRRAYEFSAEITRTLNQTTIASAM
jgi:dTDP-4-amino-4,6-dideoxygalactose transaminase